MFFPENRLCSESFGPVSFLEYLISDAVKCTIDAVNSNRAMKIIATLFTCLCFGVTVTSSAAVKIPPVLKAGVARVDISRVAARPSANTLYAKALVLNLGETTAILVTLDAVAVGEIGSIKNDFLPAVRARLKKELGIEPANVLINASHCHGSVHPDVEARTVQAVREAMRKMAPVHAGTGIGFENRIMENRRLILKNGRQLDVRHAYSLPPDEDVAAVGPVDPEIGILRLDDSNGNPLAVVYNFAMHPIQGTPLTAGDTADVVGFASKVIEDNLGGAMALFLQGCGGDINPALYKDVSNPRDAEPLGNLLGLSVLQAVRKIPTHDQVDLRIVNHVIQVPRADHSKRIAEMELEKERLLKSLRGTSLNLKTFYELRMKYGVNGDFPSYYSHRYLNEAKIGRENLKKLDEENRRNLEAYTRNIHTMEELTRLLINQALLEKHQARNAAAEMKPVAAEVVGLRVGDFRLVTFPGEVTVPIGLNIKRASPHAATFVAGYSNGYLYYCPTAEQMKNVGRAQEDSDSLLAPGWQKIFEDKAAEILKGL